MLVRSSRCGNPSSGFTIVEVLVALVVLAVGMLGIAGLYVITLRSGSGAIYRTQAIYLANDLADRIRANRSAGQAYAAAAANNNCYGAAAVTCNAAQLAANDLLVWQTQVTSTLPSGASAVGVVGAVSPFTYQIVVRWTDPGDPTVLSYTLSMQI